MNIRKTLPVVILAALFLAAPVSGKEIVKNAESVKSENRAFIRADGLACYFCAYGLERFFKKSGKVAAYDMDMDKGVVEINFIKGKPLLTQKEIHQIVYDAGYTPRETSYELTGKIVKSGGGYTFSLIDTGEDFPLEQNSELKNSAEKINGKTVRMKAIAEKSKKDAMLFEPVEFEIVNDKTER
ncbi:MAG: hypothetical protein ACE5EN_09365 [Nitrospinota bacterium]